MFIISARWLFFMSLWFKYTYLPSICFVLKGGLTKSYVISCPVENITFLKLISSSAHFIVSAQRSKIFKIGKCLLVQAFKIPQNMYRALVKIPAPCAQKEIEKGHGQNTQNVCPFTSLLP